MKQPDQPLAVAAVIAAAGRSRRMGEPKQLLPWHGKTVIEAVVANLFAADARPIITVTGHEHAAIASALTGSPTQIVYNTHYLTGEMLSSYQVGIGTLVDEACVGALLTLGDQPHIPVTLLAQLIEEIRQSPEQMVIPRYHDHRGHPIYLPRHLWQRLLTLGENETLRTVVVSQQGSIRYVDVASDAILRDMDTPADYAALRTDATQ
ncbi:MAG: NTP transferase domain-containing protein [Caldilineaceae bacterium]